jgi:hypothetical protein
MCKKNDQVRLRNINSNGVPPTLYKVIEVHDDNTITVKTAKFFLEYNKGKRKEPFERVSKDRVYIPKPDTLYRDEYGIPWEHQFHYIGDGDYIQPSTGKFIHD